MTVLDWPSTDSAVLDIVVDHYRNALVGSTAFGWLERRGIADAAAIGKFGVGFSDRTLGKVLPAKQSDPDGVRPRLQRLGVLRESGHEQFRGCVTFPIVNAAGDVVEVYGRTVGKDTRLDAGRDRWLTDPPAGVWNREGLDDEVIVCEGIVDALSFWCSGHRSVTAAAGPDGRLDELATTLLERNVDRVLVAFDNDQAGDIGASALAEHLGTLGITCLRVEFPTGSDANDVMVRSAQPESALGSLVRQAVWMDASPAPRPARQPSTPSLTDPVVDAAPVVDVEPTDAQSVDGELRLTFDDRRWRVRGLGRASSFEVLKVNVLAARRDRFHVDNFDLYSAKARANFVAAAAAEIGADAEVVKSDLGRVLLACETEAARAVTDNQTSDVAEPVVLSEAEEDAALDLLRDPNLIDRIAGDLARVGIVGEVSNGVVGYLAAVSRKLASPLAVVVQSTSAAGKSALVDAVLGFVPGEDLVRYSAVTGQSLFYMGGGDLAHKVLAVAEEEGASRASYALKLLQSDGELSIASTGKDGNTGRLVTHTYSVTGPTAIFLTTTAIDIDEELLNRCLVLSVDESAEQTRAIHARQRQKETLAGLVGSREGDGVVKVHQDAQRLLEPVAVVNPFAEQLTFADTSTRTRRDHAKYLSLIRAVTFLHQHQRTRRSVVVDGVEVVYVEATAADVQVANRVAHDVLGRSLDELPPQTRRLLGDLHAYVTAQAGDGDRGAVRFTRRQVRENGGWGDTQLKVHLARLVDLELVIAHRGDNGAHVYELAWDGQGVDGDRFVIGLTDPTTLKGNRSGSGRPPVGGRSGTGRTATGEPSSQVSQLKPTAPTLNGRNRTPRAELDADVVVVPAAVGGR